MTARKNLVIDNRSYPGMEDRGWNYPCIVFRLGLTMSFGSVAR
jgi:hypothetical protein